MFYRLQALHEQLESPRSVDDSVSDSENNRDHRRLSKRTSVESGLNAENTGFASSSFISASWPGFSNINNLVIFGDSYSDITQYRYSPNPTKQSPLGVPWPGATWAEEGEPNWVGHLLTNDSVNPNMLVFDYAVGGAMLEDVARQVSDQFQNQLICNRIQYPWSSEDSLFVTWAGINDCCCNPSIDKKMTNYYATQHELYQAGARNFLFVNVPPVHRSPAWRNGDSPPVTILTWNQKLREVAEYFQSNHSDATVMLFSSWDCFTTILDEPTRHGFLKSDPGTAGGGIWVDRLHPTSRMHDYIARDISQFLEAQPAGGG